MELIDLLRTLKKQQIHISVSQGKLSYKAPKGAVNEELKASLKTHKTTLIQILTDSSAAEAPSSAITTLPDRQDVALTTAQKQVWIAYQALSAPLAVEQYHVVLGFDCAANLNLSRLKNALKQTISEFDALNIAFRITTDGLRQGYYPVDFDIPIVLTEDQYLEAQTTEFVTRKFELLNDSPFRVVIFQTNEHQFRLIWCIHHIVCDGYSLSLISNKLLANYLNPPSIAAPNRYQFLTHAYQQQSLELDTLVMPWLEKLQSTEPYLALTQADPNGLDNNHSGPSLSELHSFNFTINEQLTRQIDSQAHHLKFSTFEYLISIYCLVVYLLTHQRSFSIVIPESGRSAQTIDTVGLFANARLLAVDIDPKLSTKAQMENIVAQIRLCLKLSAVPLEYLLSRLKSDAHTTTGNEGFQQLGFSYFHDNSGVLTTEPYCVDNTLFTPLSLTRSSHRKKLSLLVHRSANHLKFEWHVQRACLSERLARYHCDLYHHLLETIDLTATTPMEHQLPVPQWRLAQAELIRNQIENNPSEMLDLASNTDAPETAGIRWLWGPHVDQGIAIRLSNNRATLTYGQLKQQIKNLAAYFYQLGIRPGQRVYLDLKRSLNSLLTTFATWTMGAIYCPLNTALPLRQKFDIVGDSFVFTKDMAQWQNSQSNKVFDITSTINTANQIDSHCLQTAPEYRWQPQDPFYHLQTSGTTGDSKAVEVTYSNIRHYLNGAMKLYQIQDRKHVLHHTEISFDVSMVELLIGFHSGGCMTIYEGGLMDAVQFSKLLRDYRLDTISLTASHWQRLVSSPDFRLNDVPRQFKVGAEPMPAAITEEWLQRFGQSQQLFNVYGPTETTVGITGKHITTTENQTYKDQVTIGTNFLGYTLVCDPYGKPLPANTVGELWVFGPTVSNGYFQQPAATELSFFKLKVGPDDIPGYKTGDLVLQKPDGEFFILGRQDHQIKWRGYRIELNAIELRLQQHPMIKRAVLVPLRNPKGHIDNLTAIVLTEQRQNFDGKLVSPSLDEQHSLNAFLTEYFPEYCLPSQYLLASYLPLRVSGKLDRTLLEQWIRNIELNPVERNTVLLTPTEKIIVNIWRKLLNQTNIETNKNFFDHGGHSLLLLDMLNELKLAFSLNLELVDLFELTNVQQLAAYIESHSEEYDETNS